MFSWSFGCCDHERGEFSPTDGTRLQFFENLVGSRSSKLPLVSLPLDLAVRRHSTTDDGLLNRRQVHERKLAGAWVLTMGSASPLPPHLPLPSL